MVEKQRKILANIMLTQINQFVFEVEQVTLPGGGFILFCLEIGIGDKNFGPT